MSAFHCWRRSERPGYRLALTRFGWLLVAWLVFPPMIGAQDTETQREPPHRGGVRESSGSRSPGERQRRANILEYVKRHNPQAAQLLNRLESNAPTQYRQALQALEREVDSLRSIEARDPQRFELALRQWRNRTGIDVALAQIARGGESPRSRQQLQRLFEEQRTLRQEIIAFELASLEQRAQRLREQLATMENASEEDRQRQLDEMIRRAKQNAQRAGRGSAPPGAGKSPPPRSDADGDEKIK